MRDPNRIDIICEELRKAWSQTPDMRLGQLLYNIHGMNDKVTEIFTPEDTLWLEWIKVWGEKYKE